MRGSSFSPNAIGLGAINVVPTFAPTPMALGLNIYLRPREA